MGVITDQSRFRKILAVIALVQFVTGGIAVVAHSPKAHAAPVPVVVAEPPAAAPPVTIPPPEPVPPETDAADAIVPSVALFESTAAATPFGSLSNPTREKVPLIFAVVADQGEWLHVKVNVRPNGATAWIHRSDVNIRHISNRIVVEVGVRRLTVYHGNDVLAQHTVAVGAPSGPTPTGEFYVDATVHIANTGGVYGPGQMSVSGFSNVYQHFGGGVGQIAIHGTNNPGAMGSAVSHGCIRMQNPDWTQVSALAPNGTPVSIRP